MINITPTRSSLRPVLFALFTTLLCQSAITNTAESLDGEETKRIQITVIEENAYTQIKTSLSLLSQYLARIPSNEDDASKLHIQVLRACALLEAAMKKEEKPTVNPYRCPITLLCNQFNDHLYLLRDKEDSKLHKETLEKSLKAFKAVGRIGNRRAVLNHEVGTSLEWISRYLAIVPSTEGEASKLQQKVTETCILLEAAMNKGGDVIHGPEGNPIRVLYKKYDNLLYSLERIGDSKLHKETLAQNLQEFRKHSGLDTQDRMIHEGACSPS